jgi:integrase
MSVYKSKKSPYYRYDFVIEARRFHGSTRRETRREAEAVEREHKERAKEQVKELQQAESSLQLDHVAGRYWQEIGQYHAGADNTARDLARIVERMGKTKLLTEITDPDVAGLVAWRRGHRVIRSPKQKKEAAPLIANATVNRSTTEVLKKLFTYAKASGVQFRRPPNWKRHMLSEPKERIRELHEDEGERIDAATRADFEPFFAFVRATGLRQRECVTLRWAEVDWSTCRIIKIGKGGKHVKTSITSTVRDILWPLRGHHPEYVFTYVAQRTRGIRIKGERYPLTLSGTKTRWRRTRKAAAVTGFRFHDFRHDFASKLLRETGNLKLVQLALNHADLKTTARYAHVLDDEVAAALERHQKKKSRTKSRTTIAKTG